MNGIALSLAGALAALIWPGRFAGAKPPAVSFGGGDGSSMEKAVVITADTEDAGVRAEYEYIAKRHPGSRRGGQSLRNVNGRVFDVIDFTTADGRKRTLHFDITAFFGKQAPGD